MDLFGKQAKQELEALREKLNVQELQHIDVVAKYRAISRDLEESKELAAAIKTANKSWAQCEECIKEYERQAIHLKKSTGETAAKEAVLLSTHQQLLATIQQEYERKIGTLQNEHDLLVTKRTQFHQENAAAVKVAETLRNEIAESEKKQQKIADELKQLNTHSNETNAGLKTLRQQQAELTATIDNLSRQQQLLINENSFVHLAVAQIECTGSNDERFAILLQDIQQYAMDDKIGGALQLNLEARPLLLVIDMGLAQTVLALVRGGKSFSFEAKVILKIGAATFEEALANWVQGCFAVRHPLLKKEQVSHFLPSARRLFALLCQDAPQGEIEETIVIDSQPFTCALPLMQKELVAIFGPLLGLKGHFLLAVRQFLSNNSVSIAGIERIVCLGMFSRNPLLREVLADALESRALLPEVVSTAVRSVGISEPVKCERLQDAAKVTLTITTSNLVRESHERNELEEQKKTSFGFICSITGMKFVFVKGGTFQMGDIFGAGQDEAKPVHKVTLSDFLISTYPVTQGDWVKIMVNNPSEFQNGDLYPVEQVSWTDAQKFICMLSQQSGKMYRLLTEAEWEFAARSGGRRERYGGAESVDAAAWYSYNSNNSTHPVGEKAPNGLGIYDMLGNVWEWTLDWYDFYSLTPKLNPQGPLSGNCRVLRGGSYYDPTLRFAARLPQSPDRVQSSVTGFRLACSII